MVRAFLVSVILLPTQVVLSPAQTPSGPQVRADVEFLTADRLEGRGTGYPGAEAAAEYIGQRFEAIGLRQVPGLGGWFQSYQISATAPAIHGSEVGGRNARNVVALLPGQDARLAGDYLVIGAHYDHLGLGGGGSLDPDSVGVVHNGADDNASGVAALLEIARQLSAAPPARSVLFVAFSGEELGLLGSTAFVKASPVPMDRVVAMLNFDMVGRLRDDKLIVNGVETATEFRPVLDSLNRTFGFSLTATGGGYGPSDHAAFTPVGRPVLHFFTGTHQEYHRTTDDAPLINVEGIQRIASFAAAATKSLGDRRHVLTFVASAAPRPATSGSRTGGYGAWLGTIPDMSETPGGVRISGLSEGSPGQKGGLLAGDIITRIGTHEVPDLQSMTDALRAHVAGDLVDIVVLRDGKPQVFQVTLGQRGG